LQHEVLEIKYPRRIRKKCIEEELEEKEYLYCSADVKLSGEKNRRHERTICCQEQLKIVG
jgi:hypothetical protein